MPDVLLMTAEVEECTGRAHRVVPVGEPVVGRVVVTTQRSLESWGEGASDGALWIVLGPALEAPAARPFLRLPQGRSAEQLDGAIEAALEVVRLRERLAD